MTRLFLDTNVLVYAFDRGEPNKRSVALKLLRSEGPTGKIAISTQVLQEFYVVVTQKLPNPLPTGEAYAAVRGFARFWVTQIDTQLVFRAIARNRQSSFSFWDALIIEAAIESGCKTLLTEDMQHGKTVDDLRIDNPFL